jgi:hypothetical protein
MDPDADPDPAVSSLTFKMPQKLIRIRICNTTAVIFNYELFEVTMLGLDLKNDQRMQCLIVDLCFNGELSQ